MSSSSRNSSSIKLLSSMLIFASVLSATASLPLASKQSSNHSSIAKHIVAPSTPLTVIQLPTNSSDVVAEAGSGSGSEADAVAPPFVPDTQAYARLYHTSVDNDDIDVTFSGIENETGCHESCRNDGDAYQSYTWRETAKSCWCRDGAITLFKPVRSPIKNPAISISTTFKASCHDLFLIPAWSKVICEDVKVEEHPVGLRLLSGGPITAFVNSTLAVHPRSFPHDAPMLAEIEGEMMNLEAITV